MNCNGVYQHEELFHPKDLPFVILHPPDVMLGFPGSMLLSVNWSFAIAPKAHRSHFFNKRHEM